MVAPALTLTLGARYEWWKAFGGRNFSAVPALNASAGANAQACPQGLAAVAALGTLVGHIVCWTSAPLPDRQRTVPDSHDRPDAYRSRSQPEAGGRLLRGTRGGAPLCRRHVRCRCSTKASRTRWFRSRRRSFPDRPPCSITSRTSAGPAPTASSSPPKSGTCFRASMSMEASRSPIRRRFRTRCSARPRVSSSRRCRGARRRWWRPHPTDRLSYRRRPLREPLVRDDRQQRHRRSHLPGLRGLCRRRRARSLPPEPASRPCRRRRESHRQALLPVPPVSGPDLHRGASLAFVRAPLRSTANPQDFLVTRHLPACVQRGLRHNRW